MKKSILISALAAFVNCSYALADTDNDASSTTQNNAGKYYIGADIGITSSTNANVTISGVPNTYPNPGAIPLVIGYHINPAIAVELGYTLFGKSTLKNNTGDITSLSASSTNLALVGTLNVSPSFGIFGKLGYSKNNITEDSFNGYHFADGTTSASASNNSALYGVGISYYTSNRTALHIQYISYGNFASTTSPVSASTSSFGFTYDLQ